ncbi:MAG: hypothetical protein GX638_03425 [Crenarchaeota archaeon]|nr:hypothetical protein [Thermoproteota archaeon]
MNEHSLHIDLKHVYSVPGDIFEVKLGNYIIDILRNDLLIEVQTKNFSAIKHKLDVLTKTHKVRLVYPLPETKWIKYVTTKEVEINRRKSTKKGKLLDVFRELVRIPQLLGEENFSLEILFIDEEEIRCNDGKGSWRRRGVSVKERRLLKLNDRVLFQNKTDYIKLLPKDLPDVFTNKDLSKIAKINIKVAQQITYCLRKSGIICVTAKKGNALYFKKNFDIS